MNNKELKKIIKKIEVGEGLKPGAIAAKADINRSYLSTLINNRETKEVEDSYIGKIAKQFPGYFNNQQKTTIDSTDIELIKANLDEILRHTQAILTGQTAGQQVIMKSLDRLEENQEGTLAEEADRLALMIEKRLKNLGRDKKAGGDKKHTPMASD